MPVTDTHPDYDRNLALWDKVDDSIKGEPAIKRGGQKYLPKPNKADLSEENEARYKAYLERALYFNVTGRTLKGLTGQVFRKEAKKEVSDVLEPLLKNIDGTGVSIDQQARRAFTETMSIGRCGLFVDFPSIDKQASKADIMNGKVSPTINLYVAKDIDNWDTKTVGTQTVLNMVKLVEEYDADPDDVFNHDVKIQYRVLLLDDENHYHVEVLREEEREKDGKKEKEWVVQPDLSGYVYDEAGKNLNFIPFLFIGSENNDAEVDPIPLYDLAVVNISHYRNSADLEQSSFISSIPTFTFSSDSDSDTIKEANPNGITMGGVHAVFLGMNGKAELLQAKEANLAMTIMDSKQKQMIAIGARLIENKVIQMTATQAAIEISGENSILSMVTDNVSEAYQKALEYAAMFVRGADKILFKLNKDFEFLKMDAQERIQLLEEWMSGGISFLEYRNALRKDGIATEDDNFVRESKEQEDKL